MTHPLEGAELRLARAEEHLAYLHAEIVKYERTVQRSGGASYDPPAGELTIKFKAYEQPPLRFAVIVGEIVYNLRAALDYLVYALAERDAGESQSGTQLPIEDTPEGFAGRRDTYLKGISDKHVALFDALQPYAGCEWTKRLRELSNPDKHRKLTTTVTGIHSSERYTDLREVPDDEAVVREDLGVPAHMKVEILLNYRVTLDDGLPVGQELQVLQSQVSELIETFKPLF